MLGLGKIRCISGTEGSVYDFIPVESATASSPCEIEISMDSMGNMGALMGSSGYSVNIYGDDYEKLREISADVSPSIPH